MWEIIGPWAWSMVFLVIVVLVIVAAIFYLILRRGPIMGGGPDKGRAGSKNQKGLKSLKSLKSPKSQKSQKIDALTFEQIRSGIRRAIVADPSRSTRTGQKLDLVGPGGEKIKAEVVEARRYQSPEECLFREGDFQTFLNHDTQRDQLAGLTRGPTTVLEFRVNT
jgi:hypothetical protein